jgi:hypothetical protein
MEWYEIVILIPVAILGVYLRGKYFDYKRNMQQNESWKNRKK